MNRRTLWDAVDADSARAVRHRWIVASLAISLCFAVGLLIFRRDSDYAQVLKWALGLLPIVAFPIVKSLRERGVDTKLGARRVASSAYPDVFARAREISLAAGVSTAPTLSLLAHEHINAAVSGTSDSPHFKVTAGFLRLPAAEQSAAFALLIGRLQVDPMSVIVAERDGRDIETGGTLLSTQNPLSADELWTEVAVAGDRAGLMLLKDPGPIIALLERLASSDTSVGVSAGNEVAYSFLALPASKRLTSADALTAAAAEAFVSATNAAREQRHGRRHYAINPEATRSLRLQEVTGTAGYAASVAAHMRAAVDDLAPVSKGGSDAAARGFGSTVQVPMETNAGKISVLCPSCGSHNVPKRTVCFACGATIAKA